MRYRHDEDGYIIQSFLDMDFYKFTMGNFIFSHPEWADAEVTFQLQCRTPGIKLGSVIPLRELREELDHVRTLRPTVNTEIAYLRGMDIYGEHMFSKDYLEFLKKIELPEYDADVTADGELKLSFRGSWKTVLYWEIFGLAIVNELYRRHGIRLGLRGAERERYLISGVERFLDKVKILKQYLDLIFSDFGTRRRASFQWQEELVAMLANLLPNQFRGTSNTYLAMKYNLVPIGTSAHEPFMVAAGLADLKTGGDREAIRSSQNEVLNRWWEQYGFGLSVVLPDTFGTPFTFEAASHEIATQWKGLRQDSGNPFRFGEQAINWYQRRGVNPQEKMLIFSDGLSVETMTRLLKHFKNRIQVSFGWGTNLTNDFDSHPDLGLIPLSLVIKAVKVEGQGLVKLSDNISKAVGKPADIKRYREIFDYHETYNSPCKY